MNAEMALLRQSVEKKSPSSSSYATPPPRVAAPSPTEKPTKRAKEVAPPPDNPAPPPSEGARMNRLRRLCERKPSGKLLVPESIHLKWKNGGKDREALIDELERAGWSKDPSPFNMNQISFQMFKQTNDNKIGRSLGFTSCVVSMFTPGLVHQPGDKNSFQDQQAQQVEETRMVYQGIHVPNLELECVPKLY